MKKKYSNENWFMFVDAREDNNLSHDEAVKLLSNKGVSGIEIIAIAEAYQEWSIGAAFE